ncbi:MAG TPA: iron-binding protein, partial [Rhizobiales bacterium]|nr:iron-binding protein [Hyphomicrobiales bacterium]
MPHWEAKTSKGAKTLAEIRVSKDGPYLVSGDLPLTVVTIGANDEGESVRFEWGRKLPHKAQVALCRCGGSASKPYCDGARTKIGFDGTETAAREPYVEQAKVIAGPTMSLTD